MDHLDTETLSAYIDSELPPADMEAVGQHLASCAACRREAQELLAVATLVRELPIYPPRWRVEIEPDERDRDTGPIPMLLEFAKPVALAAVIILVALAGLRLVTDSGDSPEDEEPVSFSESLVTPDGTEGPGETSEEVTAPGAIEPEMADAPADREAAAPARDAVMQAEAPQATATTEPPPAVATEPAADDDGDDGFGLAEGLVATVVAVVAAAVAWGVLNRDRSRRTRA